MARQLETSDTKLAERGEAMEHANSGNPSANANRGRLQDDLEQLRQAATDRGSELVSNLRGWIEERPLPAVAAAFAVGFVISGGLFSRMTWRFARLGARTYLRSFIGDVLSQGARELFAGLGEPESASDVTTHRV
jgi:ElaB/YqjD/DUF883 family membrane-anchored ribosome-binding protein